jgi:multidrug efflux pump subunit AcrA (membrane-fusion protein)
VKKNIFYLALIGVVIVGMVFYWASPDGQKDKYITTPVQFGTFKITVVTTGELEAANSQEILGPTGLREFGIWNLKINDMVPDGTIVDSGAWVAELDRSELMNQKKDLESELEKLNTQLVKTRLDTSLTLRQAREELINLQYNLEEQKIRLAQSKYEPPATIRQIKIDLEQAQRQLQQAKNNYLLKQQKAEADMQEVLTSLNKQKRKYNSLLKVMGQFSVKAPKAGMVVYRRSWNGEKQGIGSTVNAGWDNVVAELPDLSSMISKTYVNEIDISKVKENQPVIVTIDAFPGRKYRGSVKQVANIGQQMRNSNAKVFEVIVAIHDQDSILKPAMTSKNEIITEVIDSVLFVPLEAIQHADTLSYVVSTKKERIAVVPGKSNENHIIVKKGLSGDERLFLTLPEGYEAFPLKEL